MFDSGWSVAEPEFELLEFKLNPNTTKIGFVQIKHACNCSLVLLRI
jgi:hypothetical protein